ncbi:MAG: hypothetical protein HY814_15095 [Candidatus Riflebacteria bacterium]|nr:hypothetical protein [Candidatus Riflebacteria bacterium]
MVVLACITDPAVIVRILRAMHLPEDAPVLAPARPPPEAPLEIAQGGE